MERKKLTKYKNEETKKKVKKKKKTQEGIKIKKK